MFLKKYCLLKFRVKDDKNRKNERKPKQFIQKA